MKYILSKRLIDFTEEDEILESDPHDILNELLYRDRSDRQQVDPKLNPESYTDSDNWRNHWISSDG